MDGLVQNDIPALNSPVVGIAAGRANRPKGWRRMFASFSNPLHLSLTLTMKYMQYV